MTTVNNKTVTLCSHRTYITGRKILFLQAELIKVDANDMSLIEITD